MTTVIVDFLAFTGLCKAKTLSGVAWHRFGCFSMHPYISSPYSHKFHIQLHSQSHASYVPKLATASFQALGSEPAPFSFGPSLYPTLHRAPISSLVSVQTIGPATTGVSMCNWHINNQACPPPRQIQMHLSKWWSTRPQGSIVYIFAPLFTKVRF